MRATISCFLSAALYGAATVSFAEIEKKLRLESEPPGAQLYLLRGSQRIPLGSTPLDYQAEFHSEMSILRFAFERPGYAAKTLEVSASQDRVVATLAGRILVADPATHQDERLRLLQQRLNPALSDALPKVLAQRPEWGLDIAGVVRVRQLGDGVYLHVPITITKLGEGKREEQDAHGALARQVWNGAGREVVSGLQSRLAPRSALVGLILEAQLATATQQFQVTSRVETGIEMVCVSGTKRIYDICATMRPKIECVGYPCTPRNTGMECVPGFKHVHDSCATRAPATKSTLKVDPKATTKAQRVRVYFISIFGAAAGSSSGRPAMLQLDESGRTVFKQGDIPDQLVAENPRN